MTRRPLVVTALAAGALGLAAVPAGAAKKPTAAQARAITTAVQTSPVGGTDDLPTNRYRVTGIKVSTVSRTWATANITPRKAYKDTLQSAYVVLVQPAGTRTWVVVDLGTAAVGCGYAPGPVLDDLRGSGYSQQCAPEDSTAFAQTAQAAPVAASGGTYVLSAAITQGGQLVVWLATPNATGQQVLAQTIGTIPDAVSDPAKATLSVTANADGTGAVTVIGPKNATQPDAVDFKVAWAGGTSPSVEITGSGV